MEHPENTQKEKASDDSEWRIDLLRNTIDEIDEKLVRLINERLEVALEIGRAKAQKGAQVLDSAREYRVLKRVEDLNNGPISKDALHQVFKQIMAASREIQKPHRVAYLGPEATFTHIAAMKHFGRTVSFVSQPSIRDAFNEVEKGSCHYGVVPVENSIEGAINHTLDMFFESELKICAEKYQTISHDLLSKTGTLNDIRKIYSHQQGFAKCRSWLQKYLPEVALEECGSTASALQKTLQTPDAAAIASNEAAHLYDLNVVASRIEDAVRNTTRFLIIGRDDVPRTGRDKTSVMFVTPHVPGALFEVLKPMADYSVNMVKLESRPTKHENWSYFFFVDIEGHIEDSNVKETVEKMREICLYMKFLGSYPRAIEG
ncbi:prephenate dehydratase [Desulfonema magnum]|uniref:Bifunctional chorismate mutase/prephenate dehydratase n=1 Tax=Desulfonema magnum TaxID=45655 RepID=A0A975BM27_9BACT|nr:prephenate dehydratase [Desulfonema magnum]QTA87737.1 Bifunctional chorismate mutase/prephenate dehydratase [Desulfonema magnum]